MLTTHEIPLMKLAMPTQPDPGRRYKYNQLLVKVLDSVGSNPAHTVQFKNYTKEVDSFILEKFY